MPDKRKETHRPALRGTCLRGKTTPTPKNDDLAEAKAIAGKLLRDFDRWNAMSEPEQRAYDLGRETGRAEATPIILTPDADAKGRRVRIPKLELQTLPHYVAAVSKALERQQVTPQEARAMLYAAQMLLAAWNALGDVLPQAEPAARIGFIQAAADQLLLDAWTQQARWYCQDVQSHGDSSLTARMSHAELMRTWKELRRAELHQP